MVFEIGRMSMGPYFLSLGDFDNKIMELDTWFLKGNLAIKNLKEYT